MIITYVEKGQPFDFKRVDRIKTATVEGLAFQSGDLLYFRKNAFDFLAIPRGDVLKTEDAKQ